MERWIGKVAVVTGASSGIGLATAKALVLKGMIVVGLARRKDVMLNEMSSINDSGKFYAVECNVSDEKSVEKAFNYIENTLKTVHVLVNNAGLCKTQKSIEDIDMEELNKIMGVNTMGVLYCYKYAIRLMRNNGQEGHIINMNSTAGLRVPSASDVANKYSSINVYPLTKFAMTAFSETITKELHGANIRVTNVSPGFVRTNIAPNHQNPTGRPFLSSEEVADTVLYVLSLPVHIQITQLTVKPLGEHS